MSLLLLIAIACVTSGHAAPQGKANGSCTPGTVWIPDDSACNTCFCDDNGMMGCTMMDCDALAPPTTSQRTYSDFYSPQPEMEFNPIEERTDSNCSMGEEWTEECNQCVCLEDSLAICTKMGCRSGARDMAKKVEERCKAGDTWSDGCNFCHCLDNSMVICSEAFCPEKRSGHRSRRQASSCTPGSQFNIECNECLCLDDGLPACTKRFCLPDQTQSNLLMVNDRRDRFSSIRRPTRQQSCNTVGCPKDCDSKQDPNGCWMCDCHPQPFFAGRRPTQQRSSFDNNGCNRICPADCGSTRDENGCLTCLCGRTPFFGTYRPAPVPARDQSRQRPLHHGLTDTQGWTYVGRK